MASIGNSPTQQAFTPAIDYFSGNGSTTAFTLSRPVASVAQVQVTIDNVAQNPSSAYTVSGSTITFTSAPLSGTNNIYVYYTSPITQVIAPGQGTVGATALDVYGSSGTGAENLPSGTTAQRPSSPVAGANRFNSTLGFAEFYTGTQWASYGNLSASSVSYLVVAGGGGSGRSETSDPAGGGGAGGYRTGTLGVTGGVSNTVTIGAGGLAGAFPNLQYQGGDSTFASITSTGGGSGGNGSGSGNSTTTKNGTAGGSGGGSGYSNVGGAGVGGAGTSGQGNAGATNTNSVGGGGGGSSAAGSGQTGGAGTSNSISGSAITYAAGGAGASSSSGTGSAGAANTGNGAVAPWVNAGQNGGSGVVIISYANTYKDATATGTYIKTSSGNTIYTFTGSGTITF